jgi:hypothetical protein
MRYRVRTLLMVMVAAAIFFGGYRLGWQHGRDSRFDELIRLITTTISPNTWEEATGPGNWHPDGQGKTSVDPIDPFAGPQSLPGTDDAFATPR